MRVSLIITPEWIKLLSRTVRNALEHNKYIYNCIWNKTETRRFTLLLKVNPFLEHVANSNKLTYLASNPVFRFMSVFITLPDCWILLKYRKRKKKNFSYIFNCVLSCIFKLLKLANIKHFHFFKYYTFCHKQGRFELIK